jgi:hypothetical protein
MLLLAVTIVLILLVVGNIAARAMNATWDPCDSESEYFASARKLPDGRIAGLGSIPSGTDVRYVGAKTVSTGQPGVIGLKSRNEDYLEDESTITHSRGDLKLALDKFFGGAPNQQESSGTETDRNGTGDSRQAIFNTEMEGVTASVGAHNNSMKNARKVSSYVGEIQRDGYSDRKPDDW